MVEDNKGHRNYSGSHGNDISTTLRGRVPRGRSPRGVGPAITRPRRVPTTGCRRSAHQDGRMIRHRVEDMGGDSSRGTTSVVSRDRDNRGSFRTRQGPLTRRTRRSRQGNSVHDRQCNRAALNQDSHHRRVVSRRQGRRATTHHRSKRGHLPRAKRFTRRCLALCLRSRARRGSDRRDVISGDRRNRIVPIVARRVGFSCLGVRLMVPGKNVGVPPQEVNRRRDRRSCPRRRRPSVGVVIHHPLRKGIRIRGFRFFRVG